MDRWLLFDFRNPLDRRLAPGHPVGGPAGRRLFFLACCLRGGVFLANFSRAAGASQKIPVCNQRLTSGWSTEREI